MAIHIVPKDKRSFAAMEEPQASKVNLWVVGSALLLAAACLAGIVFSGEIADILSKMQH